ncbi:arabinose-5-phosphate isomerase [Rhizobium subbaraonis]|uniref:Arabinose-5-phosphate isomerase n=1 Tax=Rhizobium subbaraonis TaxID=908946 RepID=A0A285U5H0_9HYPH|nr:KpsF/GutQ family sugar-phosphate isomerase [Rhizobium subbaraonis]SOC36927.1 arabinose-5-phosphate isomerase [Rhizobium subbaraonis]
MIKRQALVESSGAIASAIRTVETERAGLDALSRALSGSLYDAFCEAVRTIAEARGRVIVTGIGKSGHIGTKIAASLASTGTPAFFVHPVEANHGDLGMIGPDDVILAMSWSGETSELQGIVSYSRRFSIPLIAITSGERSALSRESDIVLLLPKVQEACPHGLAPTTSTLMQLALGDALVVALLEARGFTATDFKTFHPGGKLGASLTHVGDIMHSGENMPLVPLGTSMPAAVLLLSQKHYGCVGVVNDSGKLVGIVTDGDIARNLSRNLAELNVDDIMTRAPKTVRPTTLATAALGLLNQHNISALIVTDETSAPVGIVHFHDLLRIGVA